MITHLVSEKKSIVVIAKMDFQVGLVRSRCLAATTAAVFARPNEYVNTATNVSMLI